MRAGVRLAALGLALMAAACAPRVERPGPAVTAPALTGDHIRTADGLDLPLTVWAAEDAPKAVILAVHGFNDYSHAFEDAGIWLAEHGISVYAYDQRGFGATDPAKRGLWPGIGALTGDLRTAAGLLRKRFPETPLFLMGESMGGAVVLVTMTGKDAPDVDGILLVSPAVWGRATMPWYQRLALAVASHTVPWMKFSGKGLGKRASDNNEVLRELALDPLFIKRTRVDAMYGIVNLMDAALDAADRFEARALILYGGNDEIIPADPTARMIARLPADARERQCLAYYPGGYHMLLRDLNGETALKDIAAWIARPGAPLPSGADRRKPGAVAGK